jgi:hypothetical protein
MGPRFDRRTMSRAEPAALLRLARFAGVRVPDDCVCGVCNRRLVEVLVRMFDREDVWPPRLTERRW